MIVPVYSWLMSSLVREHPKFAQPERGPSRRSNTGVLSSQLSCADMFTGFSSRPCPAPRQLQDRQNGRLAKPRSVNCSERAVQRGDVEHVQVRVACVTPDRGVGGAHGYGVRRSVRVRRAVPRVVSRATGEATSEANPHLVGHAAVCARGQRGGDFAQSGVGGCMWTVGNRPDAEAHVVGDAGGSSRSSSG